MNTTHDDFRTDDQMVRREAASLLHFLNRDGSAALCGREGFVAHSLADVTCTTCAGLARAEKEPAMNAIIPDHYGGREDPYEVFKVIRAWEVNFFLGNALKYIRRAGKKDPSKHVEDLEKAKEYIQSEIDHLKKGSK